MLDTTTAVVFLVILSVLAISLNGLCIHIIRTTNSLWRKPSSFLVLNLLFVHFIQGFVVFPMYAGKKVYTQDLFWKRFFANGFRIPYMLTFYGTVLAVLFISIDRLLATYLLNLYKHKVTRKRVCIALCVLWLYIIALCAIPFSPSGRNNYTNSTKPQKYYYVPQREWALLMLIVNTALPYGLIIFIYIYIMFKLREMGLAQLKVRKESGISLIRRGEIIKFKEKELKRYKQVAHLTLFLVISYGLFWTPSIIYFPLKDYCKSCFPENYEDSILEQHLGFIIKYLAFLDAIAAPLIYCFLHTEFRRALRKISRRFSGNHLEMGPINSTIGGDEYTHIEKQSLQ